MTQEKMRRLITACVSAATVLLVFLLCFLLYQWITIGAQNRREEKLLDEIAALNVQYEAAGEDADFYESKVYLQWKLDELKQKQELLKDK